MLTYQHVCSCRCDTDGTYVHPLAPWQVQSQELQAAVCMCVNKQATRIHTQSIKPAQVHRYHNQWQRYILTTSQSTGQHLTFMHHRNSQQQHQQKKNNKVIHKESWKTAKRHVFASELCFRRRHSPGLTWVWHMQQLRVELQSSGAAGCASALQALTAAHECVTGWPAASCHA